MTDKKMVSCSGLPQDSHPEIFWYGEFVNLCPLCEVKAKAADDLESVNNEAKNEIEAAEMAQDAAEDQAKDTEEKLDAAKDKIEALEAIIKELEDSK